MMAFLQAFVILYGTKLIVYKSICIFCAIRKKLKTIGRANCAKNSKTFKLHIAFEKKKHRLIIYILLAIHFLNLKK